MENAEHVNILSGWRHFGENQIHVIYGFGRKDSCIVFWY